MAAIANRSALINTSSVELNKSTMSWGLITGRSWSVEGTALIAGSPPSCTSTWLGSTLPDPWKTLLHFFPFATAQKCHIFWPILADDPPRCIPRHVTYFSNLHNPQWTHALGVYHKVNCRCNPAIISSCVPAKTTKHLREKQKDYWVVILFGPSSLVH